MVRNEGFSEPLLSPQPERLCPPPAQTLHTHVACMGMAPPGGTALPGFTWWQAGEAFWKDPWCHSYRFENCVSVGHFFSNKHLKKWQCYGVPGKGTLLRCKEKLHVHVLRFYTAVRDCHDPDPQHKPAGWPRCTRRSVPQWGSGCWRSAAAAFN